jgi:hypothetical protein
MPLSNPVIAIPIVDTSASMTAYGYVAITVIDTKAFMSNSLQGDYIGVVSYDVNGVSTYPLTIEDAVHTSSKAAALKVQNLSFNGNCTNIGGGLQTAVNMLSGAPTGIAKGFVLLSDGYHNCGTNPIPLPTGTPPVYACAMGANSDSSLMHQIATTSGGAYYYAPYVYNMMGIYNQIRSQAPQAQLLANDYKNADPYDYLLIPATVSRGNDLAQFSVVWSDPSYQFTNGQPGANQLSVTLVTPAGIVITPQPDILGAGYVTFNIPTPALGQWYLQIMYGGAQPIGLTGGVFEYAPSGSSPVSFKIEIPTTVKTGKPIPYAVTLSDNGKNIDNQQIQVVITQPKISITNAIQSYAHLLKDIKVSEEEADQPSGIVDRVKLNILHKNNLKTTDLLPHLKSGTVLTQGADGKYSGVITDTLQAGSYNLQLEVIGYSAKTDTPFQRNHLVSILVED